MNASPHALGGASGPRLDGYLRLTPSRRLVSRASEPTGNNDALLFIDVEDSAVSVDDIISSIQQTPDRLTPTRYVLLRWPDITGVTSEEDEQTLDGVAKMWVDSLADRRIAGGFKTLHWGVVRFRVGADPVVTWADAGDGRGVSDAELLQRALRVELESLLRFGHAIWRPKSYHYVLPSGQHAAAFIRVGDAFRSPRDVRVIASWLTPRMRDKQAVVADSATLVPLITDIHALLAKRGWRPGRVEMLDEYPRTKLDISRVIVPLRQQSGGVLALMSVNSSGRYRGMFLDGLEAAFTGSDGEWSMVVMVDKTVPVGDAVYQSDADGVSESVVTWYGFQEEGATGVPEGNCLSCKTSGMAQVVRIDPRTFEALVMPEVDRQMPSYQSAQASTRFWELCAAQDGLAHTAKPADSPSSVARPKSKEMGVLIDNVALLRSEDLAGEVQERLGQIHRELKRDGSDHTIDYTGYEAVLVSKYEADLPGFSERLEELLPLFGLGGVQVVPVDFEMGEFPLERIEPLSEVVVFALGSVTGWNLRQLLLGVQEAWRRQPSKKVAGIVLNARPATRREWQNLRSSFSNRLDAIWTTFLPRRNPLEEEQQALESLTHEFLAAQPQRVLDLIQYRLEIVGPRVKDWRRRVEDFDQQRAGENVPDPHCVLWGLPPYGRNDRLRNQSLYGFEVGSLTAFVAVGSAIHATRQSRDVYDPRWLVFDIPAISRSYYDAIILACILRWTESPETWWGANEAESAAVMSELLARTADPGDRLILIPELLLAASQGKVPNQACAVLREVAQDSLRHLDDEHKAPTELGLALLDESSFTRPAV